MDSIYPTMRGPLDVSGMPYGLKMALEKFDKMRTGAKTYDGLDQLAGKPCFGPELNRLERGLRRLTNRGLLRIARESSGVCKVYMSGKYGIFRSLNGLFYWNDGHGVTRRRVLMLAWKKGAARSPKSELSE